MAKRKYVCAHSKHCQRSKMVARWCVKIMTPVAAEKRSLSLAGHCFVLMPHIFKICSAVFNFKKPVPIKMKRIYIRMHQRWNVLIFRCLRFSIADVINFNRTITFYRLAYRHPRPSKFISRESIQKRKPYSYNKFRF